MVDVNTSIYSAPQQENILTRIGQAASAANAIEQNKLLKGQQVQQDVSIDQAKLNLAVGQLGQLRGVIGSLMANPNTTRKDVENAVTQLTKLGIATPMQAATIISDAPTDQRMLRSWLQNHMINTVSAEARLNAMMPAPGTISTGGGTTIVQTPQIPGLPAREIGSVPNTLAPTTEVYDPEKRQKGVRPQGEPGRLILPGGSPGTAAPQGITPPPAAPGSTKDQGRVGIIPTQAPLGEGEGAAAAAAPAGAALTTEYENSRRYQEQVNPLEQAIPALERLGKTGTGPGTETLNHIKSFAMSMGMPGVNEKAVVDFDKAKKYLTDFVNQNGNTGTNDKLAAAFAGNPSVNIANAAAVDVAKTALTLRRMREAGVRAFDRAGLPEKDFSKFMSKWQRDIDPRIFGVDLMQPAQRAKVLEGLPEGKRQKFMLDMQDAEREGLLRPPPTVPPAGRK